MHALNTLRRLAPRIERAPDGPGPDALDVPAIRRHFAFPDVGRVVTNNAASTQPARELTELFRELGPEYENVHRGQSEASKTTTRRFEASYDDIAAFVNAPGRGALVACRNATEANNAVMYSLMTEFRDGDNVVTTMMEHNSNYVPWYALCHEILPRFGVHVECRLVGFDPDTGEVDLAEMASLVGRTKLVCCSGASNFLGTKNPLPEVRAIAASSGYAQPDGERGSLLRARPTSSAPSPRRRPFGSCWTSACRPSAGATSGPRRPSSGAT
jgi:cysteine desulfurase / selenocysteine lyase